MMPLRRAGARDCRPLWRSARTGQAQGLFTGYYEPQVEGATKLGGRYQTALLGRPRDLVRADLGAFATDLKGRSISGRFDGNPKLVPYYDRAQMEHGALASQQIWRCCFWLIRSTRVLPRRFRVPVVGRLADGRTVRVTYDGQNGRRRRTDPDVCPQDARGQTRENVRSADDHAWLSGPSGPGADVDGREPVLCLLHAGLRKAPPDEGPRARHQRIALTTPGKVVGGPIGTSCRWGHRCSS